MLESIMEDLIAKYPTDFFPRKIFTLVGRQGSFSGVGRFDLLFKDEHQTNILMELKARPAKYEDASQLAKYNDALKEQGKRDIIMWLVATVIPSSVREFLDRIGIEYTEIHESEYRAIALRNNVIIESEQQLPNHYNYVPKVIIEKQINRISDQSFSMYKSKLTPRFKESIDKLRTSFPGAYEFIYSIPNNDDGFWLSTSINAHLYYKDSFLAYIEPSYSIRFCPRLNNIISSSTVDRHTLIFPEIFEKLTKAEDGSRFPWASHESRTGSFIIKNQAPSDFFNRLLLEIRNAHIKQFGK